ncbi:MAG: YceI family protein [Planctomycetota bacterium]
MTDTPSPSRLKRWTPALIGLALAGVGVGAAGVAASQVSITITPPEAPSDEPDPVALLRDDVAALQADLTRLSQALEENLGQLGSTLDQRATDRSAVLERKHDRALARLEALSQGHASLAQRFEALQAAGVRPDGEASEPIAAQPEPAAPEPAAPEPEPEPEPAPAKQGGLFSFKLSGGLDFDERLRFEVISSLSRVGFDGKSTLHDFSGVTSQVEGWLTTALGATGDFARAEVSAEAATLKTGVDGRDEEMRKLFEVEREPEIRFTLAGLETTRLDREAKTLAATATGTLRIHGVEREVSVPVELSVDASKRLELRGEVFVNMSDFGIEPPTVAGGAISMEDQVKVWLSLRLRSLGKAQQ